MISSTTYSKCPKFTESLSTANPTKWVVKSDHEIGHTPQEKLVLLVSFFYFITITVWVAKIVFIIIT